MRPSGFRTPDDRSTYASIYDEAIEQSSVPVLGREFETSFGMTHVLEAGSSDAPPLVALHAKSCSSVMWLPLLPTLTKEHHVFMFDAVGDMNLSVSRSPLARPSDVVTWLDEATSACGIDGAAFVGASIGAWMATHYALARPDKVERLALLCPGGLVGKLRLSFLGRSMAALMIRSTPDKVGQFFDSMAMPATRERLRDEPWRYTRELFTLLGTFRSHPREARPASADVSELGSFGRPILVVIGRDECLHDGPRMATQLGQYWPSAEVNVINDASHLVFIDQTDQVIEHLEGFLATRTLI